METKKKRIAVIGAGLVGLMSCIEVGNEPSLEPICFERTDNFGGTWRYREEAIDGQASLMPTTTINHSKELGANSMFPPCKEYANYMKHSEVLKYLTEQYEHFGIAKYVTYNAQVVRVTKAEDYEESGRWLVTTKDLTTSQKSTQVFDGVIVGSGHISKPKFANYPGQDKFRGKIMHTHNLKDNSEFKGQNVLVIGMGCSGLDAAVDVCNVADKVYLSTRSGAYILNRVFRNGYPVDAMLLRRFYVAFINILGPRFCSWFVDAIHGNSRFDMFKVKPKYNLLQKDPVVNDLIFSKLMSGSIIQTCDVKRFTENGVEFEDGEKVDKIDTVIMATGYSWAFPFLDDGILKVEDGKFMLYKCMFPTHLPHGTLAFGGFILPSGPINPIIEMQARVAAKMFAGAINLPSEREMVNDVIRRHKYNTKRYVANEKATLRVDEVEYVDELANLIGAKPKLVKYLFKDFSLFRRLVFGPSLPYQYRLDGPDTWDGAREAIMTSEERMRWPLTRSTGKSKGFIEDFAEYIANLIPNVVYHL